MKKVLLSFALLFSFLICTGQALAEKFSVYCVNGKIELDSRNLEQMIAARGKDVYTLITYSYRMDAKNYAKRMGGIGAKCPKK